MTDAIILSNISKIYRVPSLLPWKLAKKIEALRDVTFSCPMGKITCLLGPNGAGKTTAVKILAGLVLADSGTADVLGTPLSATSYKFQRKIGLLTSNDRSFYWRLTGRQNLDFFAALNGLKSKQRRERISSVLSEVDLKL